MSTMIHPPHCTNTRLSTLVISTIPTIVSLIINPITHPTNVIIATTFIDLSYSTIIMSVFTLIFQLVFITFSSSS